MNKVRIRVYVRLSGHPEPVFHFPSSVIAFKISIAYNFCNSAVCMSNIFSHSEEA